MVQDAQLAVIREAYARLIFTHKTHEKERERLAALATISKWVNITLSAVTFGGILVAFETDALAWKITSVVIASLAAGYAVFQLSFDPSRSAESQRTAAKQFLRIRNGYETLIADVVSGAVGPEAAHVERNSLRDAADEIYASAPDTSPRAYGRARAALKFSGEMTFTDEEIDSFLPEGLRSSAKANTG